MLKKKKNMQRGKKNKNMQKRKYNHIHTKTITEIYT